MTYFYRDGNDWKEFTLPKNQNDGQNGEIVEVYDKNRVPFSPKMFFKPAPDFDENIFEFSKKICADYEKRLNGDMSEIVPPEYLVYDDKNNIIGYLFCLKKGVGSFKEVIDAIKEKIVNVKIVQRLDDAGKELCERYAYFSFIVRISFLILKSLKKIWMRGFFLPELTESDFFVDWKTIVDLHNPEAEPLFFFPCADDIARRYYAKENTPILSFSEYFIAFLRKLLSTEEEYLSGELKENLASPSFDIDDLLLSLCSFIGNYQFLPSTIDHINLAGKKTFSLKRDKEDENEISQQTEERYRLYAGLMVPVCIYDPLTHRHLWLYYANKTLYIKNEEYIECRLNADEKNRLCIPKDSLSDSCIEIQIKDDLADLDIHPHFQLVENKIVISQSEGN